MQAVCRPSSLEKVPALQLTHDVAPAVDVYLPTGQVVHQEDLATEKVPAVQLSQADPLQLVPASQLHLAWAESIEPPKLFENMSVMTTLVSRSQQRIYDGVRETKLRPEGKKRGVGSSIFFIALVTS